MRALARERPAGNMRAPGAHGTRMSAESLIVAERVSRYYGELCAVDDLSMEVRRGEVLGFLGPNGAGKTTTMQMLAGTLAPSSGRVLVAGIDLLDRPKEAKRRIGYLPEQPPLHRELTVDEYLRYCARLRHVPRRRVPEALSEAKARCGLADTGRRLIGNLSKGYQQRVAIAQAVIHAPSVVILDEPTVGLDPIQIREIRALIRELGGEHSVILSTHILPEVQAICDRVQIIHRGRLVLDERLDALDRGARGASIRVGLRHPPPAAAIEALPGLARAEDLGEGQLRLHPENAEALTEALVAEAAQGGWGLYQLTPEARSLEELFVQLTLAEGSAPGEARTPEAA